MADKKITQLTDLGDALASVDLFHVVDDPTGTPINKKISAEDVFNNVPTWIGMAQASQTLTGDGSTSQAINTTTAVTEVAGTGGPLTLGDGADGQIKTIIDTATATHSTVITPTNLRGYTTITLNATGETVVLMFKNSNWNIIGGHGFAAA